MTEGEMRRMEVTLCIVLIVILAAMLHNMNVGKAALAQLERMEVELAETKVDGAARATIVIACIQGEGFVWHEPHSGVDYAVFCESHTIGRLMFAEGENDD